MRLKPIPKVPAIEIYTQNLEGKELCEIQKEVDCYIDVVKRSGEKLCEIEQDLQYNNILLEEALIKRETSLWLSQNA